MHGSGSEGRSNPAASDDIVDLTNREEEAEPASNAEQFLDTYHIREAQSVPL